jgi:SAM-dependent methyltransferase
MEKELIHHQAASLTGNDREFFLRVWNTPADTYIQRLKAIGFSGLGKVLDAGFGFGQWLLPLATLNSSVTGIEFSQVRFDAVGRLIGKEYPNLDIYRGTVEEMPFPDNSFDGIFSYSVILCTDYRKTLAEFYRVLKPGGKLYFNTNGLGWYLHNLLTGHNDASDFSSKTMAINAMKATIAYYSEGSTLPGECIITPVATIRSDLKKLGFGDPVIAAEGTINIDPRVKPASFFKGEYLGEEGVFEVLVTK